jgi:hypothetical protein
MENIAIVKVDYEEGDTDTYEGIVVERDDEVIREERSGDFDQDEENILEWVRSYDGPVAKASSVDHFLMDRN